MNAAVSLYELTCRIRNAISTQLPGSYWVRAEISEGRQNANGHFYCRFIEKNAAGTDIASAARNYGPAHTFPFVRGLREKPGKGSGRALKCLSGLG